MKIRTPMALAALAISLTSCATPRPPQTFHNTDNTSVVIGSLDDKTSQMLEPTASGKKDNDMVLVNVLHLSKHQMAKAILKNYGESQVGLQYRIRGTPWFVGLRSPGYEHDVSLQGRGTINPEGLITLTEYF